MNLNFENFVNLQNLKGEMIKILIIELNFVKFLRTLEFNH